MTIVEISKGEKIMVALEGSRTIAINIVATNDGGFSIQTPANKNMQTFIITNEGVREYTEGKL